MRRVFRGFAVVAAVCAASAPLAALAFSGAAEPARPVASQVEVLSAEFGLINLPGSGKPVFVAARHVPLVPGQGYGWIVKVRPTTERVRWREEFSLPATPSTWGEVHAGVTQSVTTDGRTSVKEAVVVPSKGTIFNVWAVAEGDPPGNYVIRVFIGNKFVRSFEFEVK